MKKIDYIKLGEYFGNKCEKYFNNFYSKDTRDYFDEIANANEEYDEKNDIYKCTIEIVDNGKILLIDYFQKLICDENENIIDVEYYI